MKDKMISVLFNTLDSFGNFINKGIKFIDIKIQEASVKEQERQRRQMQQQARILASELTPYIQKVLCASPRFDSSRPIENVTCCWNPQIGIWQVECIACCMTYYNLETAESIQSLNKSKDAFLMSLGKECNDEISKINLKLARGQLSENELNIMKQQLQNHYEILNRQFEFVFLKYVPNTGKTRVKIGIKYS